MDFHDVCLAAARIAEMVIRTRSFHSPSLTERTGVRLLLKAESEQRCGAFKFRGALNAMLALAPRQLRMGVVAGSSGNHGHAVALAARMLDTTAVIVLPRDVPTVKRDAVLRFGGQVVIYDPSTEERDVIVARIAAEQARVIISSYDDAAVIAGAGTVAVELLQDAGPLDVLLVPVGGGGLAAGCAVAIRTLSPATRVIGVEPAGADDTRRSLLAGRLVRIAAPTTIADGLRHRTPGRLTFALNRRLLDRVVMVSDLEIRAAMRYLFQDEGLIAEPSGACALAAVLAGRLRLAPGTRVCAVVSGGNVDDPYADSPQLLRAVANSARPECGGERSDDGTAWDHSDGLPTWDVRGRVPADTGSGRTHHG
jgi:threonine dehydratase